MLDRPVARPAGATSWPQRWLLLGLVLPVIVGLGTLTSYQGLAVASLGAGVALGLLLTLPVRGWPLLVAGLQGERGRLLEVAEAGERELTASEVEWLGGRQP